MCSRWLSSRKACGPSIRVRKQDAFVSVIMYVTPEPDTATTVRTNRSSCLVPFTRSAEPQLSFTALCNESVTLGVRAFWGTEINLLNATVALPQRSASRYGRRQTHYQGGFQIETVIRDLQRVDRIKR